jgi:hypothetical protein
MKGIVRIRLFAAAAVLAAGAVAPKVQAQPNVLGHEMFVRMDANQDDKVSKREYIDFGTAYLKKKGKPADRFQMEAKFGAFDRDGDGYITAEDPTCKKQTAVKSVKSGKDITHVGRISVICKVEKKCDRKMEEKEIENKNTHRTVIVRTFTKTKSKTPTLAVTIYNRTTHPDTYMLEWYSFAKLPTGDQINTNDSGSENITVGVRNQCKESITPKTMVLTETTIERENENGGTSDPKVTEKGRINAGYLVLLKHGDTILDRKASCKKYLTDQWLAGL